MKSKILSNTIIIIFVAIIFSLSAFSYLQHKKESDSINSHMSNLVNTIVEQSANEDSTKIVERVKYINQFEGRYRFTLINSSGKVIYDSKIDPSKLDNHIDREEIKQLEKVKIGNSRRYSTTLDKEYQYIASKLSNDMIIRVSTEVTSPVSIILSVFTIVFIISLLATYATYFFISKILDKNFNKVEEVVSNIRIQTMDDYIIDYEGIEQELIPLINIINKQKREIAYNIKKLKDKIIENDEILDNMNEGLIMLDDKNVVVSLNKSAVKLLNIKGKSKFEGEDILSILKYDNLKELINGNRNNSIIHTGENTYLNLYVSPFKDSDGNVKGKIVFIVDISATYLEEQYRREFSTNISHELKTPLTSINGYAEMISLGLASDEDIKKFSKIIYTQGNHLLELIDDIIKLSKIDEEYSAFKEKTEVNVSETVHRIANMLELQALDKNVTINMDIEKNIKIKSIEKLVDEVIQNILSNAIKYNVENGKVDVRLKKIGNVVNITIEDSGIGISKENLERVFERFYQVDKSRTKSNTYSTGLGLAIVKHAAKLIGAKLSLESELGVGTKVNISIPVC